MVVHLQHLSVDSRQLLQLQEMLIQTMGNNDSDHRQFTLKFLILHEVYKDDTLDKFKACSII